MGVRLRTTLTATAAVAVALCLASIALFAALDSSLAQTTRALAQKDAAAKAYQMGIAQPPGVAVAGTPPGPGVPARDPAANGVRTQGGSTGGPTGGSAGGPAGATNCSPVVSPAGGPFGKPGVKDDLVVVSESYETRHGTVTVKGKASNEPARAAMNTLTDVLAPGVPALLALVALFTWLAVGRALRPVSAIRAKLADITEHDLHERVPEPAARDEVAALARTVNATLDRLRSAVAAHRQFVADAAHELRSPMAILRTRLELAGPAEKVLADDALDDVARLQTLTADLLFLARLDVREPLREREVDLAQVVAEEAARRRPRADVRVALRLTPGVLVRGSADHLRRLVANLVDNAVRHAAGTVTVGLTAADGHAVLDVTDDGPGIPPEHHGTVFDRFTRLDHARARDTGGSGLGLPIARDIATAHHATLTALPPAVSGAHLRAVFPLLRTSDDPPPEPQRRLTPTPAATA